MKNLTAKLNEIRRRKEQAMNAGGISGVSEWRDEEKRVLVEIDMLDMFGNDFRERLDDWDIS
jgi:hypothetical protein